MSIRIPINYSYKEYPFSPMATDYSKKLALRKAKKTGVAMAMLFDAAGLLLGIGLAEVYAPKSGLLMFAVAGVGVWAGLDINRTINKHYEHMILYHLQKDLGIKAEL